MTFTKITTAGAGTMGSQVAWQMAFHGKHVTVYDAIAAGLEKGKAFHQEYAGHFMKQRGATRKQIDDTFARLTYTTDLAAALRDADLISESVPESLSIKESFWREASRHAPARSLGVASGQGFYSYPNPAYARPEFIAVTMGAGSSS